MKGLRRVKLALGVLLVLLLGTVSSSHAQTKEASFPPDLLYELSTASGELSSPEDINYFLTRHYLELTPDQRDLLQKAILARKINDGQGSFLFQPPVQQARIVGQVFNGLISSLWPSYDEKTKKESPGVLGALANWTDAVITSPQPVTAQQMLASLNPAKRMYAQQGQPFSGLPPGYQILGAGGFSSLISEYWLIFRNFAYALLTVVLIIFGFMIMLRQNLEPRVIMTISNALPRIATALVLITFSFAISGLLIDVGRVADGVMKTAGFRGQDANHSIFSLLREFAAVGLTGIGASLESPEYVWKFDEESLDRDNPTWRCDYDPSCWSAVNFGCTDARGIPCEPYYCSLLPYGMGGKNYECKIWILSDRVDLDGWGPMPPFGPLGVPLISPTNSPAVHPCLPTDAPCNTYPPPNNSDVCPNAAYWRNTTACCNLGSGKCHGDDNAWAVPFPRVGINILEMWINRLILILISAIINLLFFITLLQTILTLLFTMITCFAMWFIYAITSPLIFMWATIPGQEDTATSWMKNFLANVLAFPVVNFAINLALAIALQYNAPGASPGAYPSILFIGPRAAVGRLVAFGIILMTPQIPTILKDVIGAKGGGKGAGLPDMTKQVKRLPIIGGLMG
ncbi:MAG: hypothetical protein Q8N84_02870 [bacterium]|nr:hypothetical protein [bacterium]